MKSVYLAGQPNEYADNWKEEFKKIEGFKFYDPEYDSDQSSPDTFYPQDLAAVKNADILVANPGTAPSEATWMEVGYFINSHTKNPGDFCESLIIIWSKEREPRWSIEFVRKAGHLVETLEEAKELLVGINQS